MILVDNNRSLQRSVKLMKQGIFFLAFNFG